MDKQAWRYTEPSTSVISAFSRSGNWFNCVEKKKHSVSSQFPLRITFLAFVSSYFSLQHISRSGTYFYIRHVLFLDAVFGTAESFQSKVGNVVFKQSMTHTLTINLVLVVAGLYKSTRVSRHVQYVEILILIVSRPHMNLVCFNMTHTHRKDVFTLSGGGLAGKQVKKVSWGVL